MAIMIGRYDRRLQLRRPHRGDDIDPSLIRWVNPGFVPANAARNLAEIPGPDVKVWGERRPLAGGERFFDAGVLQESDAILAIRRRGDVRSSWQVEELNEDSRATWYIRAIADHHRAGFMLLAVSSRPQEG